MHVVHTTISKTVLLLIYIATLLKHIYELVFELVDQGAQTLLAKIVFRYELHSSDLSFRDISNNFL